jgi:hypothetical protein
MDFHVKIELFFIYSKFRQEVNDASLTKVQSTL